MTDHSVCVTRRRLLGSIATVVGAGTATGAGTVAYLSDSESSSDNTIQAGTLDLKVNESDVAVTFLNPPEIEPDDSGSEAVTIENTGSVLGTLEVAVTGKSYYENGIDGKEKKVDDSPNTAELQEYLEVRATVGSEVIWKRQKVTDLAVDSYPTSTTIDGDSGQKDFTVEWWFANPETEEVYRAESDSVEIDLSFRLTQSGGG